MRRRFTSRLVPLCIALAALVAAARAARGAELVSGLGGPAGYGSNRLPPSALSSCETAPIDLRPAFPDGITFLGVHSDDVCVNANGTVSLHASFESPMPSLFPRTGNELLAPWWAGIDIASGSTSDPTRNAVYWDVRPRQFVVTWHDVGHDGGSDGLVDDFQLVIRTTGCYGAKAIEFRYHRCDWTAANASGGSLGHCAGATDCTGAVAGFDAGDLVHYYDLPGSGSDAVADLCHSSNVGEPGVWRFHVDALPPCGSEFGALMCNTGQRGACEAGVTVCDDSGHPRCGALRGPTAERCDGIDNDCDGDTDEGADLCAPGEICENGACVAPCADGRCPLGWYCSRSNACVNAMCDATCPAGMRCGPEGCVESCDGVHCPDPTICLAGDCIDPCERITCPSMQVCVGSRCVDRCDCAGCLPGETCGADGRCRPIECDTAACAAGEICTAGEDGGVRCVDPCADAVCPIDERCEGGRCVAVATDSDAGLEAEVDASSDVFRGDVAGDEEMPIHPPRTGCACGATSAGGHGANALSWLATTIAGMAIRRRRRRS